VQGGGVNGVVLSAEHELLGKPLAGGGVELRIPGGDGPFTLRLGGEWLHGQADRIGVPCAGLVRPGTCAPEPVHDRSQLTTIRGGATLRVYGGQRSAVNVAADWMMTRVSVDTHGFTSGYDLSAAKILWGPWIGVSADWVPVPRVPIGLELEGGIGELIPVMHDEVLDGYTPFEGGFAVHNVRLGLVWRPWIPSQR
jgi:hypothetical protein